MKEGRTRRPSVSFYFFIVPPGDVPLPILPVEPAVGAPELLASPADGAIPVPEGLPPGVFVMPPPGPPVVLPLIDPPVVVPLAAGPPADELPPAVPPAPEPVWAMADDATMAKADAIAIVLMLILFPRFRVSFRTNRREGPTFLFGE